MLRKKRLTARANVKKKKVNNKALILKKRRLTARS